MGSQKSTESPPLRRSDRLFELIQILRDGRLHRAQRMANRLGVSVRTVYRDMETLMASGVPVQGERGLGYQMTAPITLPPLNLTLTELEALHLGLSVVGEAGDPELQKAAATLSAKIDAVLPEDRSAAPRSWGFAIYPFADAAHGYAHMPKLRAAIRTRQKLDITYTDLDGAQSNRTIRPLALEYWGRLWTVTVWCEWADDFRVLRVDRITALKIRPELFVEEQGKTLIDYHERAKGRPEGD